ncbi:hypothetical protein J3R73_004349 [Labrys monachus]|uniref:Uncharacterized protein n=1 Tax=Labrys monachus TaxID=217067 RepID=A0ABU0FIW2_9HYPH|nr:hypothetical protein [Labrys monachus]
MRQTHRPLEHAPGASLMPDERGDGTILIKVAARGAATE